MGQTWDIVEQAWKDADNRLRAVGTPTNSGLWEKWRREDAFSVLASDPRVFRVDLPVRPPAWTAEIRAWLRQRNADYEFVRGDPEQVYFFVDHAIAIEFKMRWA